MAVERVKGGGATSVLHQVAVGEKSAAGTGGSKLIIRNETVKYSELIEKV